MSEVPQAVGGDQGTQGGERRPSVREVTHALLGAHGLTTVFGNPGSNELPFLADLPEGFRYVLGLHEGAVVGMADGYAQATGRPALVNLHAASGTGNAMGALTNADYSRTPLLLTAGQQVRTVVGLEGMLANVDAAALTRPLTGFAAEPLSPQDVPRTMAQALFESTDGHRGPTYVSVPYDDWTAPYAGDPRLLTGRTVSTGARLAPGQLDELAERLRQAQRPLLVVGSDLDRADAPEDRHAWELLVSLAERLRAPVWLAPSPFRLPFPNRHPLFRGVLPAGIASVAQAFEGHDVVLVLGAPVFRYHQHEPGDYLPAGTELLQVTDEPGAATRAPMGRAWVADPLAAAAELLVRVSLAEDSRPEDEQPADIRPADKQAGEMLAADRQLADRQPAYTRPEPAPRSTEPGVLTPAEVFATLRDSLPQDTSFVVESTSTNAAFWAQMDLRHPLSYFWPASGGLGFGLPAAVGVALAAADEGTPVSGRRVVAIVGDGSVNYGVTALWTAAQLRLPLTVVVLRNGTYGALRWFAGLLGVPDSPGLDVPGIDFVAIAQGYGVRAVHASTTEELADLLSDPPQGPLLVEVDTTLTAPG